MTLNGNANARLTHFHIPPEWGSSFRVPEIAGVVYNGCVSNQPFGRMLAHSHIPVSGNEPFGWACFMTRDLVITNDGRPTEYFLHEMAHLITGQDHTPEWAAQVVALGGVVPTRYTEPAPSGSHYNRIGLHG